MPDLTGALVEAHARRIRPLFSGLDPDLHGAVLAALFAQWLASHTPDARPLAMADWTEMARKLTAIYGEQTKWGR